MMIVPRSCSLLEATTIFLQQPYSMRTLKRNIKQSEAITAYKLYPGRSNYTCAETGWDNVADFALNWTPVPSAGELD
jgi:hypothetical protein